MAKRIQRTARLSPELAAALASGATVPAAEAAETTTGEEEEAPPAAEATTGEEEAPSPTAEAAATTGEEEEEEEQPSAESGQGALVSHLQGELKEIRAEVTNLNVQLSQANNQVATEKARADAAAADVTALRAIVNVATERLCVALNTSPALVQSADVSAVCEMFNKLDEDFKKRFKVGAASKAGEASEAPTHQATASSSATVAAVRATKLPSNRSR